MKLGLAAGTYFGKDSTITIGMDTRMSGPGILKGVVSGLTAVGCNVVDLGPCPTPAVQYSVRAMNADGGLVVTASHNPPEFNGLKFISGDGTEFSREQENEMERIFSSGDFTRAGWDAAGRHRLADIKARYKETLLSRVGGEMRPLTVVVDCANGAAWDMTPDIFTRLGCRVITLNGQPDGRFPGRPPEPTEEHLKGLMDAVRASGADMGVAHDGDADRAVFVDDLGRFVTGDRSLALFAMDALKRAGGGKVVLPVNISRTVLDTVERYGGAPVITPVGSPGIARRMMENGAVLGGEGNGGVIFPEHQYCRDGMMTAARMAEIVSAGGELSGLLAGLPEYCLKRARVPVPAGAKERIIARVREEWGDEALAIDGVKLVRKDYWVLVRASGTEPIIRVTVETVSEGECTGMLREYLDWLKGIISEVS